MLSAVNGRTLGQRPVPPAENRWIAEGRFVLAWEKEGGIVHLVLHDVAASKEVWHEQLALGSRACLIDDDEIAMLQPDGSLTIRGLDNDRVIVAQTITTTSPVETVRVLASQDQYLLITSSNASPRGSINSGLQVQPIQGQLQAFDRATGEALWQVPAHVEGYGLPAGQPLDSPALWFLNQYTARPLGSTRPATTRTAVMCLDKRTGRLLYEKKDLPSAANSFVIEANRSESTVKLSIPNLTVSVRFTDEPTPPEPPAQLGQASSATTSAASRFGKMTNSLMDALLGDSQADPFE
jgi:hypothetical protein